MKERLTERIAELNLDLQTAEAKGEWDLYDYTEGARDAYEVMLNWMEEQK